MKAALDQLDQHRATLGRLLKNFPTLEDLQPHVAGIWPDKIAPAIYIAERRRLRVAQLFGADGWKRHRSVTSIQARKEVDGVLVIMDRFEPLTDAPFMQLFIAPELLTGREAGSVREVEL